MSKKFITLKCRSVRKLYLDDISKVFTYSHRKTPKLPTYQDSDTETVGASPTPPRIEYKNGCLSPSN